MSKILSIHPTLRYAEDIKTICNPLKKLGISYFGHAHIDNLGRLAAINNNPAFFAHYINHDYQNVDIHHSNKVKFDNVVIWDEFDLIGTSLKMNLEGEAFGVKHIFTIIEKGTDSTEYFHFATHTNEKSMNQKNLNNIDLLKLFIFYFKDQVKRSKELASLYDIKINIDNTNAAFAVIDNIDGISNEDKQGFIRDIKFSKFESSKFRTLSLREVEILYWLYKGMSAPEVAKTLRISTNTVNKHLANIKVKAGYHTQFQLGVFFSSIFQNHSDKLDYLFNK